MVNLGVLVTGNGTNLLAIQNACESGVLKGKARVGLVISSSRNAPAIAKATALGIPTKVMPLSQHPSREALMAAMADVLEEYHVTLVCAAGYMLIITEPLLSRFKGRMLNIHPSYLPEFDGKDPQQQALDAGASETGCTVHVINEVVDGGRIILQERVAILDGDTVELLSGRIRTVEHRLYPQAIADYLIKLGDRS